MERARRIFPYAATVVGLVAVTALVVAVIARGSTTDTDRDRQGETIDDLTFQPVDDPTDSWCDLMTTGDDAAREFAERLAGGWSPTIADLAEAIYGSAGPGHEMHENAVIVLAEISEAADADFEGPPVRAALDRIEDWLDDNCERLTRPATSSAPAWNEPSPGNTAAPTTPSTPTNNNSSQEATTWSV